MWDNHTIYQEKCKLSVFYIDRKEENAEWKFGDNESLIASNRRQLKPLSGYKFCSYVVANLSKVYSSPLTTANIAIFEFEFGQTHDCKRHTSLTVTVSTCVMLTSCFRLVTAYKALQTDFHAH